MIAENLASVERRIAAACARAGRDRREVQLVAVTKTQPLESVRAIAALGVADLAENRVQDARERIAALADVGARWHFIGHLQSNKAKYLPGLFEYVHSVDSAALAEAVGRAYAKAGGAPAKVFLQVNVAREWQKHGAAPEEAAGLLAAARGVAGIEVAGLMCMAPLSDCAEDSRAHFRALRELRDAIGAPRGLSMGMTNDFEVAVEEGATHLRVGSALFG